MGARRGTDLRGYRNARRSGVGGLLLAFWLARDTAHAAAPAGPEAGRERVGPLQYLREVRDEMRKVAWPKWPEVRRFSIIVFVTVVLYTAYVGGLDALFGVFSSWLYD